ncbi:MAG: calcium/sodium antiporter [Planctomycetota bacterium]
MATLQVIAGLLMLIWGGEWLVRGAASLAAALKISPLVIGLTVVAFGTSAPELGVSLQAAFGGDPGIAVGNVVGSNIINVLFVLGAAALVTPLAVSSQLIRRDLPLMVLATIGMWSAAFSGTVSRGEGGVMFAALLVYIVWSVRSSRKENRIVVDELEDSTEQIISKREIIRDLFFFISGLIILGLGSRFMVGGAVAIAAKFGISKTVVGLTVVAIGTSLPEVVTSVVASFRGQRDIAVGNIVGSNLFNVLCVLALTATSIPGGIPVEQDALNFDLPVMVAVAVLCLPTFWTGKTIHRWEGVLFVFYYGMYTTVLVGRATGWAQTRLVEQISVIAIALTLIPVFVTSLRQRRISRIESISS